MAARKRSRRTKKVGSSRLPRSAFLVKGDAKKPSTWRLPVRTASGKIDRRRVGAATAALGKGFRGRKYGGPNKTSAKRRLNSVRRQAGMKPV